MGCSASDESRPPPVEPHQSHAIPLGLNYPFETIELPNDNQLNESTPTDEVSLGPWESVRTPRGVKRFHAPLPYRLRSFFYSRPPEGMSIQDSKGTVIPHKRHLSSQDQWWTFNGTHISLHQKGTKRPAPGTGYTIRYPRALEREQRLNFGYSGIATAEEFARATVQVGTDSRPGLLLPAPSQASFVVDVPPSAELSFNVAILPPEISHSRITDGATLIVEVESEGTRVRIQELPLSAGPYTHQRLSLSQWENKSVQLHIQTMPGKDTLHDYVFLADPVIASRQKTPRRAILIFVDTLRPDHLSAYGYERDTSPFLASVASKGVRFTQARSIAPWTLPSYRTMVTGQYPNRWQQSQTLQHRLRSAGWATAMFAGNVYLSTNFEGNRDWGYHYGKLDATATNQVDQAIAWLDEVEGRDALALIHLMDPHLPYIEPDAYRQVFAGVKPARLPKRFTRTQVLRAGRLKPSERSYIKDRYDNNIRYVDDELERLFQSIRPTDLVLFFSDHGEEFWDHGRFEHGHTLWDELVHIPLIASGPGVKPGAIDTPVSLLDLTPTVLDWAGLPDNSLTGRSLWPLLRGEELSAAQQEAFQRPLGFGQPLYGNERWGVLHKQHKYQTHAGQEWLHDHQTDPKERQNLLSNADLDTAKPWRSTLGQAYGQSVPVSIRFAALAPRKRQLGNLVVRLTLPEGIETAWVGEDPLNASHAEVRWNDTTALIEWHAGYRGPREVYVLPKAPLSQALERMELQAGIGDQAPQSMTVNTSTAKQSRRALSSMNFAGGSRLTMTYGMAPAPLVDFTELSGHDDELSEMLKAMGYVTGNEDTPGESSSPTNPP